MDPDYGTTVLLPGTIWDERNNDGTVTKDELFFWTESSFWSNSFSGFWIDSNGVFAEDSTIHGIYAVPARCRPGAAIRTLCLLHGPRLETDCPATQ